MMDVRYATFDLAFQFMEQRNAKILVETGTARFGARGCNVDGCSTLKLGKWAKLHDAQVFSVDNNPQAIAESENALRSVNPSVAFYCMDSIAFLEHFDQVIDFLYLDSYDFERNNPTPSQQHHLKEIIAAYPHLGDHSVVMIDDCDLPHGGKGKLVIPWLQERGWKIALSNFQTILIKD